ncbi:CPBP family intramembrane glutamic endopeptidase [Pseudoclavibacter helvolus]|uniref:CPBP family intramembrane glutamic endopeptidase n=1 Tax=Pseudoclavibacter helvolus TaxID=255205 RepID=UPI003C730F7B
MSDSRIDVTKTGGSTNLDRSARIRLRWEIWLVLALAILPSSFYAVISLAERATRDTALADQTTTLNASRDARPLFDALLQVLSVATDLVPVALVIWILWTPAVSGFRRLGLDARQPLRDVGQGVLLAACIGIPGILFYLATRALGLTISVEASAQDITWWTVLLLLLAALRAALLEEVVVVGYLVTRLRELGWATWQIIVASSLLRGSYHLYQGPGMALGNVVMGGVFSWWFLRTGRVGGLVVAHFILDAVSFLGYPLAAALLPQLFT